MGHMAMLPIPNPANIVKVPLDLHVDGVWYPLISSTWSRALAWLCFRAMQLRVRCGAEML